MKNSVIRGNSGKKDTGYAVVNDSRLYMFIQRYGEKVKSTAKIRRGLVTDKFTQVDVYIK